MADTDGLLMEVMPSCLLTRMIDKTLFRPPEYHTKNVAGKRETSISPCWTVPANSLFSLRLNQIDQGSSNLAPVTTLSTCLGHLNTSQRESSQRESSQHGLYHHFPSPSLSTQLIPANTPTSCYFNNTLLPQPQPQPTMQPKPATICPKQPVGR